MPDAALSLVRRATLVDVLRRALRAGLGLAVIVVTAMALAVTAGATPRLTAARPSIVEGLPVPVQAKLQHTFHDSTARYLLPVGVSLSTADAWYSRHLPAGKPWRGWSASPSPSQFPAPPPGLSRSWKRGTKLLLLGTSWKNAARTQVQVLIYVIHTVTVMPGTQSPTSTATP